MSKTSNGQTKRQLRVQRVVSRQDVDTLYDLFYVCERLYWKSEVGNKQAQDRMDELHNGKHKRRDGFFVQTRDVIDKVRATLPANAKVHPTAGGSGR